MYTLAEKKELEKLISKCKDLEGKTNYNYKRKKHVPKKPKLFIVFIAASEELSCRSFKGKTWWSKLREKVKVCKEMPRKIFIVSPSGRERTFKEKTS